MRFEPNRYLGGARNAGARYARGKYVLFMDDDNYAKSFEVWHFVRAAENTLADVMTSGLDFIRGEGEPESTRCRAVAIDRGRGARIESTCEHAEGAMGSRNVSQGGPLATRPSPGFVFLGPSSNVGLFKNCYGDANSFFRMTAFEALGGYSEDRHVGYEDWEMYSTASLAGYHLETVPKAMYFYRFTPGSMQKSTSYRKSRKRALRAYLGGH